MILKIKFNYACEVQVNEEEMLNIKKNFEDDEDVFFELTEHVNEFFLADDGRTETGMISNFNYKVEK